jgi:hypothetical protein
MQENGQQWLENATRAGSENIAESGTEIESLLKAQNWQELATLPAQAFWRQFQHHVGGAQALQVAIKNQTTFTQGLQKAIQDWQKSVTQAVGQAMRYCRSRIFSNSGEPCGPRHRTRRHQPRPVAAMPAEQRTALVTAAAAAWAKPSPGPCTMRAIPCSSSIRRAMPALARG